MPLRSALLRDDAKLRACLIHDSAHVLQGAIGDHVAKIQIALGLVDSAAIDSGELSANKYGPSTAAAVLVFKTSRKIINFSYETRPDNIVGKMTIAALDKEMLAEEDKPIVVITQSLVEVLRLFFLTIPSIIAIIGSTRFQFERQAENLESVLGVSAGKPARLQLNFGLVVRRIPRRRFPFPIPPFLETLFNTVQSNPSQDPATAAFVVTIGFLVLLALALAALRTQRPDPRTRTIVGNLERLEQTTVLLSVDQARKTQQEVKENDKNMQECRDQKPNLLGSDGKCTELAKIYDQIKADLLRKLTQYVANPFRFPNLRQDINKLLVDIAQAFADLKDCLGCDF